MVLSRSCKVIMTPEPVQREATPTLTRPTWWRH